MSGGLGERIAETLGSSAVTLRWMLMALVAIWALAAGRGHQRSALGLGSLWAFAAGAFWVLPLAHPLGFGLDAEATRSAGLLAVSASTGRGDESVVAGEVPPVSAAARLAALGLGEPTLYGFAALSPALTPPLLALALLATGGGQRAALTAILLLTASSGDLDVLRGTSIVSGGWYWPEAALWLPLALAAAVRAARHRHGVAAGAVLGLLAVTAISRGLGLPAPAPPVPPGLLEASWALSLDHGLWLALAALRAFRVGGDPPEPLDRAGLGLTLAGAITALAGSAGLGPLAGEPWAGFVIARIGVLLLAGGALSPLLDAVVAAAPARLQRGRSELAAAVLILVTAPGAAIAWWEPQRVDPLYLASLEPLSARALEAARWLDRHAPPQAVVACSPHYAAEVLRTGRRRLLRAPSLVAVEDDERRRRAEKATLIGREARALQARYGLRYVFVGPGDFGQYGVTYPDDIDRRPGLVLRHVAPGGFRIYELAP